MDLKTARRAERQRELERLYVERDKAFAEVQRAKAALGKAEDRWLSIKNEIAELHRANGQRG